MPVVAGLLALSLAAAPAEWQKDSTVDGVTIELRPVEGSPYTESRLTTTSPLPLTTLCDAMMGKSARPPKIEGLSYRDVIKASDTELIVYERVPLPVISDRDYTLHVQLEQAPSTGRCEISVNTIDDPAHPQAPSHVRMHHIRARWSLVPREDGTVGITYVLHSDPGGTVPAVFIRMGARRAALESLKNVLSRAQAQHADGGT